LDRIDAACYRGLRLIAYFSKLCNFLIGLVGRGFQFGPFGTAATNRSIVPAMGDYDDGEVSGMMIDRGNRSTRRKRDPLPLCPPQIPHAAGREPGPPLWEASD
jgi:hypothetical protein